MSQIECYEPEFVRQYLNNNSQTASKPLSLCWQHEVRLSLPLNDSERCRALLASSSALELNVSMREASADFPALPDWAQSLNQASLDAVGLPGLTPEARLYALGILLSYAAKLDKEEVTTPEVIATLPKKLEELVREGALQCQFNELPSIPTLQRQLTGALGTFSFDWSLLPESPRKQAVQLQIGLFQMQDDNGLSRLHQQMMDVWRERGVPRFADMPWVFINYLYYRLYHETFPHHDTQPMPARYLTLVSDYFLLRSLLCLWMMDGDDLSDDVLVSLVAMFEAWRCGPLADEEKEALLAPHRQDEILSAISLLTN
ncbi:lysine-N-methylase [Leminorella grimontii]|uniref:Lysine-N-methylase n=1 Tax=Leminorella grimontii TaxID=82981 RepID=A0AAV5N422_9GAMM|nr:hypothetical protein [Leminorella grimontii]KFC93551.1 lysine-N-methylase [Leminorella grimontii ATCC 33999 = DSM 5078]GKX55754.1 lysine-N-methylase [Leminorella grimontii]GKX59564.1 lysine-N-methylase [Leminorella grimontii]VFS55227.1 Uncharacterised protein [Leminorella grimontii]